jgi:hypothetical protein
MITFLVSDSCYYFNFVNFFLLGEVAAKSLHFYFKGQVWPKKGIHQVFWIIFQLIV